MPFFPAYYLSSYPQRIVICLSIVKIWEEAFSKAVKEPGFIEFAKRRKLILNSLNAQEYVKAVMETYPKVEKFQQMLKG